MNEGAMQDYATIVTILVLGATCGCNNSPVAASPTTTPDTSTSTSIPNAPNVPTITVGQEVSGTMVRHGAMVNYDLTAPSSGTLDARLNWSMEQGNLTLYFAGNPVAQGDPPIVTRVAVKAGQQYRLTVADAAPWDYDVFNLRYEITTVLE